MPGWWYSYEGRELMMWRRRRSAASEGLQQVQSRAGPLQASLTNHPARGFKIGKDSGYK